MAENKNPDTAALDKAWEGVKVAAMSYNPAIFTSWLQAKQKALFDEINAKVGGVAGAMKPAGDPAPAGGAQLLADPGARLLR